VAAVTDGPYIEAKEFLAGFYAVECDTAGAGRRVAAMIPDATSTPSRSGRS
jgi:hypothetical protein